MKNALIVSMAIGVVVGAISVSLCKPAQKFVKNSTQAIKEEAKAFIREKTQHSSNYDNSDDEVEAE